MFTFCASLTFREARELWERAVERSGRPLASRTTDMSPRMSEETAVESR